MISSRRLHLVNLSAGELAVLVDSQFFIFLPQIKMPFAFSGGITLIENLKFVVL